MATKFYRKDGDFYEEGTNRYIGATEFGKGAGFEETNKPAGSLEDTLSNAPSTPDQFSSFRNVMDMVTKYAYNKKPSVTQVLTNFNQKIKAGKGVVNPAISGGIIEAETGRKIASVSDTYRNTLRIINGMEETKRQATQYANSFLLNMTQLGVLQDITGAEYDVIMQTGVAPMETLQKISKIIEQRRTEGVEEEGKPTISEQLAAEKADYNIVDGKVVLKSATTLTSPSGKSYDMSTYAANATTQTSAVQNYLNNIDKFNTIEDIDNYIQSYKPDSPLTGQMIANAATDYGIGWEELTALIQHEAVLGTSPASLNNNNLGGITWSENYQASHPEVKKGSARPLAEGGNYVKFSTLQDGVNAVAEQLSNRITTEGTTISPLAQQVVDNPSLISTMTPTQATAIREELAKAGIKIPEMLDLDAKIKLQNDLKSDFNQTAKEAKSAIRQIQTMNVAYEEATKDESKMNAASQGVLVVYQKMLDPTSVVRESEYARSGTGLSLAGRMQGWITKLEKGGAGLTIDDLKDFVDVGNEYYEKIYKPSVIDEASIVKANVDKYGLDINMILTPEVIQILNEQNRPKLQDPETGNKYEYDNEQDPDYIKDLNAGFKPA